MKGRGPKITAKPSVNTYRELKHTSKRKFSEKLITVTSGGMLQLPTIWPCCNAFWCWPRNLSVQSFFFFALLTPFVNFTYPASV